MRHDIFPTPVWHIEGEIPQQLIDELYQGAYRFKERYPTENRSNEGGYQTPAFEWNKFHPQGKEYIESIASNCIDETIKGDSWWYNINPKGTWNTPHCHPGVEFALVLYLTDSDGLLKLMNPFTMRMDNNQNVLRLLNRGSHTAIDAKKGDILIFPGDLLHYVIPNPREEDRISISVNLLL